MTLFWPYALIALPVTLAGLLVLFVRSGRERERMLAQFASARLLPLLLTSHSPALRRMKQGVVAVGVLLAVFAFSRPQWGYDWEEQRAHGVDVVFVIDTSRSMLSQDVRPNRLERAKLAIFDCLEKMGSNRVGLVAFAGDAFLQCPLTLDYDAFRQTLQAVDTNTIADGGTDISVGLDVAAKALEESGNHKIIVLLTDGEDLEGEGIGEAKALADKGVTVFTVGVGTPEGEIIPIRDANGHTDFVRDQRGEIVKSHLDSTTLTQIAAMTKGFYAPLGATGEGLLKVYEDGIKKIPEQNMKSQMRRQAIERFQWPLAAGFVLLVVEMLIGTRRPSWRRSSVTTVNLAEPIPVSAATGAPPRIKAASGPPSSPPIMAGCLFLAVSLATTSRSLAAAADSSAPAPTDYPPSASGTAPAASGTPSGLKYSAKDAEALFQQGNYAAAANAYEQVASALPLDSRFRYNEGESRYRGGDFEGAAQAYTKALSSNDLTLQQRSYYNLGNAHYRLGQNQMKDDPHKTVTTWESAVKDYQNALDLNSTDTDARYNLALTTKQLEALKKQLDQQDKQQQQQQNQSDQNNPPDQKDQDQKDQNKNNQDQNNADKQNQNQPNKNPPNQSGKNNSQNNQNNSAPNDSGDQKQNQQNSPDNKNPDQSKPSQPNPKNPADTSQKNPSNNSPQPKPQNGTGDKNQNSQPQNQPGQQGSRGSGQQQPPQSTGQRGAQPPPAQSSGQKPAQPQSSTGTGKEPGQPAQGQQKPPADTAGASSPPGGGGNPATASASGVTLMGVMTRDEARQLLDSLKAYEHKLPADPVQVQAQGQKPASTDPAHKDW